ncbi:MAG: XdhC family protein [Chloroflexi bacterium]|nr:XdhC family protein [Chloroflexota bacterium]
MLEILADLDRWQQEGEEIALATLVGVEGSAPRLPGARLLLTRSGRMAGSVSGGCVEGDVYERALAVLDSGQPAVASYGIDDEEGFRVGLSCGGTIRVLIEPFATCDAWQALRRRVEAQEPAAFVAALTPAALVGRKLTILPDGSAVGSIDPAADEEIGAEARRWLREERTGTTTMPLRGKEMTLFVESFPPPPRLYIVGATHAAIALCQMAAKLGFRVTVIDARSMFATAERFPEAEAVLRAWPDEALADNVLDGYSYLAVLSHDPKFDLPALAAALRSDARYIGAMGSRATHARRLAELRKQGFTDDDFARIRAPIGLDIGGQKPEETALAILAEMLAVRYGRDGTALSAKQAAIHAESERQ